MSKTLLERQQILAERINKSIYSAISKDRQDNLPESNTNEGDILWHHRHTCVFKMLSNNKNLQQRQCKEYRKKHNIKIPDEWKSPGYKPSRYDYCDFCPMTAYIVLNENGELIYANHIGG